MQNTVKLVNQASKLLIMEDWSEIDCVEFKADLDVEADWAREVLVLIWHSQWVASVRQQILYCKKVEQHQCAIWLGVHSHHNDTWCYQDWSLLDRFCRWWPPNSTTWFLWSTYLDRPRSSRRWKLRLSWISLGGLSPNACGGNYRDLNDSQC